MLQIITLCGSRPLRVCGKNVIEVSEALVVCWKVVHGYPCKSWRHAISRLLDLKVTKSITSLKRLL